MAKKKPNYTAVEITYSGSESHTFAIHNESTKKYLDSSLKETPFPDGNLLECDTEEEARIIARVLNKNSLSTTVHMIQKICHMKREAADKLPYEKLLKIAAGENNDT